MAARSVVARFCADESGATAIEYGLICSLIFLVVVGAVNTFANNFGTMMGKVSTALTGAL